MNEDKSPTPWWSWAPHFPHWAIFAAAVLYDLITTISIHQVWWPARSNLNPVLETYLAWPIVAFLSILVFIQLNSEVIYMILTLKANQRAVQDAEARGEARGIAEGQTQGKAQAFSEAEAWFQQHQADPDNAPPPPWLANGNGAGSNGHAP